MCTFSFFFFFSLRSNQNKSFILFLFQKKKESTYAAIRYPPFPIPPDFLFAHYITKSHQQRVFWLIPGLSFLTSFQGNLENNLAPTEIKLE